MGRHWAAAALWRAPRGGGHASYQIPTLLLLSLALALLWLKTPMAGCDPLRRREKQMRAKAKRAPNWSQLQVCSKLLAPRPLCWTAKSAWPPWRSFPRARRAHARALSRFASRAEARREKKLSSRGRMDEGRCVNKKWGAYQKKRRRKAACSSHVGVFSGFRLCARLGSLGASPGKSRQYATQYAVNTLSIRCRPPSQYGIVVFRKAASPEICQYCVLMGSY